MRVVAARIDVRERVLQHTELRRIVAYQQIHRPATVGRERLRQPRDVTHGDLFAVDRDVVAHRQVAAPRDLAARRAHGTRQLEMRQVEPDRITEPAEIAPQLVEAEPGVRLRHVQLTHPENAVHRVRMCHAYMRQVDQCIRPPPCANQPSRRAPDVGVLPRNVEPDGAVATRPLQRVIRAPWHLEHEVAALQRHGVEHQELAEAALCTRPAFRARRKDVLVVPVAVAVLDDLQENIVRHETLDQDAPVEKVARVPAHRGAARSEHHDTGTVRDFQRIQRDAGQDRPADTAKVQPSLHGRRQARDDEVAHPATANVGAREQQHRAHGAKHHHEHRDEACHQYQPTTTDHRVRTPARSRRRR